MEQKASIYKQTDDEAKKRMLKQSQKKPDKFFDSSKSMLNAAMQAS